MATMHSMHDERAMLLFARLAAVSTRRRQLSGRDRFLVLAGTAATRAGWPAVARRCHDLVTVRSPRHLLARYESFADALRDDDCLPFIRRTERFCSLERAEHLLSELGLLADAEGDTQTAGEAALAVLDGIPDSPDE